MYAVPLTSKTTSWRLMGRQTLQKHRWTYQPRCLQIITLIPPINSFEISATSQEENGVTTSTIFNIPVNVVPQTPKYQIWSKSCRLIDHNKEKQRLLISQRSNALVVTIVMESWFRYLMQIKRRVNRILTQIQGQYPDLCQWKNTKNNKLQILLKMKHLSMFQ